LPPDWVIGIWRTCSTRDSPEGREYDLGLHRDIDLEVLRGFPPFVALTQPKP